MQILPSKLFRFQQFMDPQSGKSVMVAMDHTGGGIFPGLEDYESVLKSVIAAGPDAVMLNMSMVRHYNRLFKGKEAPAIVAALDLNMLADKLPQEMMVEGQNLGMATVEDAVRYGASAVKVLMTWGQIDLKIQHQSFERIGYWAERCAHWNLPFIVEPNLWGQRIPKTKYKDPQMLGDSARVAVEMGADALKIDVPEDYGEIKKIIEACGVPVFLLGGSKGNDAGTFFERVDTAIKAGAGGIVVGRSVWQSKNITKMVQALKMVVHENRLAEAVKLASVAY